MNSKEGTSLTASATASASGVRTLANGNPQKVFLPPAEPRDPILSELPALLPPGAATVVHAATVAADSANMPPASDTSGLQLHHPPPDFPPPPPQYDTSLPDHTDLESAGDLCRKLSCSGHTCNSQEADSLNSAAYTDEDDDDVEAEEEEEAYYHLPKTNQDCSSLAIESHSCQTYEDHATQTEDEDSENELKEDFLAAESHFHGMCALISVQAHRYRGDWGRPIPPNLC